jgi:hypothetical protein
MTDLPNLADLLALRRGLDIVHQVPGRIRLRLGPEIWAWATSLGLDATSAGAWLGGSGLSAVAGVTGARLNAAAASLVIEYDPDRLDQEWWETLILGEDDEALALVLGLGLFAAD